MNIRLSVVFLAIFSASAQSTVLPPDVVDRNCRRDDPNLNACLLRRAREVLPLLCAGLAGIPGFDPLHVKHAEYSATEKDVSLHATLRDITLTGHRQATISKFEFNPRTLKGHAVTRIPELRMRSNLQTKGSVLNFPIDNHAIYNWLFIGVNFAFKFELQSEYHRGVEYYTLKKLDMRSYTDNALLELQSVDPRNQNRDDLTSAAFNSDPRLVLDTMNKFLTQSVAEIYKSSFDYVLHRFPAEEILRN